MVTTRSATARTSTARVAGPPIPWMMLVLWSGILAVACYNFAGWGGDVLQKTPADLLAPAPVVSSTVLGYARLLCFLVHAHRLYVLVFVRSAYPMQLQYTTGSKLKPGVQEIAGRRRLVTFTVQTWTLQTIYYALAAAATLYPDVWMPRRATHWLFEIAFGASHLVSGITSYVLVPVGCAKWKGPLEDLPILGTDQKVVHNVNVVTMHVDAFLSGQRLAGNHWGLAILYGCYYVAFAWQRCRFWSANVPYFFLDYTLPTKKGYAFHLGLAFALVLFFFLASLGLDRIASLDLEWRCGVHAAVAFGFMRLKPPSRFVRAEQEKLAKTPKKGA